MDAVKFIREYDRMCDSFSGCAGCEIDKHLHGEMWCKAYIRRHPEEAVAIVEQWAKEHPAKTRQTEVLKIFPSASKQGDGILTFCPRAVDTEFLCPRKHSDDYSECVDCRRDFWLAEMEDEDDGRS